MMPNPSYKEMSAFARSLWLTTYDAPLCEAEAVAWLIKNRFNSGYSRARSELVVDDEYGRNRLMQTCAQFIDEEYGVPAISGESKVAFDNTLFCRAFSTVCLVWNGDVADPIGGATRCHRHDNMPDWAQKAQPSALIGSRLFYSSSGDTLCSF